jgi:hypothetical protein
MLHVAAAGLADALDVALGLTLGGRQLGPLRALALELLEAILELGQTLLDVVVALSVELTMSGSSL